MDIVEIFALTRSISRSANFTVFFDDGEWILGICRSIIHPSWWIFVENFASQILQC